MNKPLVIIAVLVILGGGSFIAWQLLSSSEDESSSANPTPVSESTSSIDPIDDTGDEIPALPDESNDQVLTAEVVSEYSVAESCWTIIQGNVYDITAYVPRHPGGVANIVQACGTDGTELFEGVGEHQSGGARGILEEYYLGPLEG